MTDLNSLGCACCGLSMKDVGIAHIEEIWASKIQVHSIGSVDPMDFALSRSDIGFAGADDSIPADDTTTETIVVGVPVTAALNEAGDRDWFRFEVGAAGTFEFSLDGSGDSPVQDTFLRLYDGGSVLVDFADDGGAGFNSLLTVSLEAGLYFVEAASIFDVLSGGYTLTVQEVELPVDTIPDNASTTATIEVGGTFTSDLEFAGDRDWIRLEILQEGFFEFNLDGSGETPLSDTFLSIYNADGVFLGANDDVNTSGGDFSSRLIGNLSEGTYYLEAAAYQDSLSGTYTLSVEEFDFSQFDPLDAIDWGGTSVDTGDSGVVEVYFAQEGEVFDGVTSEGWNEYEIAQAIEAFSVYESFLEISFSVVDEADGADFRLVTTPNIGALGYMYPPDAVFGDLQGIGVFNNVGTGWSTVADAGLEQGGFGYVTLIHEFGHGLGLAHPHDTGGGSEVMLGVQSAFGSLGVFDLNQGVFTTMSYNDGWETSPMGTSPSVGYGHQGTISAFDVALLQERYGANTSVNAGNTTYRLPTANGQGTFYSTLWDTGGVDTIRHNGSAASVIDLRAATLEYEQGGGGWVSYVEGIFGGFTIANGAIIERAFGGSGDDAIFGNDADNVLRGRDGHDAIEGMAGNDQIRGQNGNDAIDGGIGNDDLRGGHGDDEIQGGDGNDSIRGGTGNDDLSGGIGDDLIYGGTGNDAAEGGEGNDTIFGQSGEDVLNGDAGDDYIHGGSDNDTINGGSGADNIRGGSGNDTVNGDGDNDTIRGGSGDDVVSGGDGDDLIFGNSGLDDLFGGAGNDDLRGGSDADFLNGGAGNDMLRGNRGADHFFYDSDEGGVDTIFDYRSEDIIQISDDTVTDWASFLVAAEQVGRNIEIDFGDGDMLILNRVALANLTEADFIFSGLDLG